MCIVADEYKQRILYFEHLVVRAFGGLQKHAVPTEIMEKDK